MDSVAEIFELLSTSPKKADLRALELLQKSQSPDETDGINWARAYALVELKRFSEALTIWQEMFARTQSHKALHQIGYVHRSAGNLVAAQAIFLEEKSLINSSDVQATAVNLYELANCSHLMGESDQALTYFKAYERVPVDPSDLVERACFYRLKGDIYRSRDKAVAKSAYEQSAQYFRKAGDEVSLVEVLDLLIDL